MVEQAFTSGYGTEETIFSQLPDSVYKPHLVPSSSPTALVKIAGDPVPAIAVQSLMSRMCPSSPSWTWEAVAHGTDAFLIGFPSVGDLQRMDGMQMGVPSYAATTTDSIWKKHDVLPMRVLEQVWVHVQGVPYPVRHFLGI